MDGLVGHDPAALRYLENTYLKLQRTEPNLELLVTGDLTAQSLSTEFDEAEEFLAKKQKTPPFHGLGESDWLKRSVPGNHDQWPGLPFTILGTRNARVGTMYPLDAYVIPSSWTLPNGFPIVFLGLNGDADVRPFSRDRFLARGSFVSAVQELRRLLLGRNDKEVRVLLLHHSLEYPGQPLTSTQARALEIDNVSRGELEHLLQEFDIRVVLSGHAHDPFFVGIVPNVLSRAGLGVLEGRCGTTTQRLKRALNSLLVHRISQKPADGTLWWQSALYVHRASRTPEFEPAGAQLGQRDAEAMIQIYP